jgi:hypothetical protein
MALAPHNDEMMEGLEGYDGVLSERYGYQAQGGPAGGAAGVQQDSMDVGEGPGAGWKTKRALDEYQRAMESVVDRNFSLSELCPGCGVLAV